MMHPGDAAGRRIVQRGVLVSAGVWPNGAFVDGKGINVLTGDDSPGPFGGDPVLRRG
jgi:hypothetical protein